MTTMQTEVVLLNRLERDLMWFHDQSENLKKTHLNEFLAIKDEKIIADGKTVEDIIEKLKAKKQNLSEVLIKFVSNIAVIF